MDNDAQVTQPQPRDWLSQARRGVIELAALVLIGRAPHYGYEIAVALSHWQPLAATEGTLYPLLRRLQREGFVDAFWQESRDGPPRKYYRLTAAGAALRDAQLRDWERLTRAVAALRARRWDDDLTQDLPAFDPSDIFEDEEVPNGAAAHRQPTLPGRAPIQPGRSAAS